MKLNRITAWILLIALIIVLFATITAAVGTTAAMWFVPTWVAVCWVMAKNKLTF